MGCFESKPEPRPEARRPVQPAVRDRPDLAAIRPKQPPDARFGMDDARFGVGPDDSEEYDESIPAPRVHLSPRIPALKRDSIKGSASEIGDALDEMGRELAALCRVSDEAGMVLEIAESAADVSPALRGKLAQLHGNAGQFVTRRLDTIVTGDMTSGRDEVRARRKQMVSQCEALIERTRGQISRIDELRAAY